MEPIKIGKVEVVNVFKTKLKSTVDGKEEIKDAIGTKLIFLQDDPNNNWAVRGEITVPGALTFGAVYDLMLTEHKEKPLLVGEARKFQTDELVEVLPPDEGLEVGELI
jgi:hypothetical protein